MGNFERYNAEVKRRAVGKRAILTALTLTRSDPTRNLHRYYRLNVQPDLYGAWCFIREWGRLGRSEQVREVPFPSPADAQAALDRQRQRKERKGYA
jgi:predicted DNA-binding WGR domain protein